MQWSTPSAAQGLPPAAAGLAGSAARARSRGRGPPKDAAAQQPPSGRAQPRPPPADRHRQAETAGLGRAWRAPASLSAVERRSRDGELRCTAPTGAHRNALLDGAGRRGGVRAGLGASRRRAPPGPASVRRGQTRRATPGDGAAVPECAHQYPRSIGIAAGQRGASCISPRIEYIQTAREWES